MTGSLWLHFRVWVLWDSLKMPSWGSPWGMPTNLSEEATKKISVSSLRWSLSWGHFLSPDLFTISRDWDWKLVFFFQPMDSDSLVFPLNSYWIWKLKSSLFKKKNFFRPSLYLHTCNSTKSAGSVSILPGNPLAKSIGFLYISRYLR